MSRYVYDLMAIMGNFTQVSPAKGPPFSAFYWVKSSDLVPPSGSENYYIRSGDYSENAFMELNQSGTNILGRFSGAAAVTATSNPGAIFDNLWVPMMITYDGSTATYYFVDYDPVVINAANMVDLIEIDYITFWRVLSTTACNVAHLTYWDRIITPAEYLVLIDRGGGAYNAINPTALHPENIACYLSCESNTFTSEFGTLSNFLFSDDHYTRDPIAPSEFVSVDSPVIPVDSFITITAPEYTSPGTQINKVLDTITDLNASTWFSNVVGTPQYTEISLPAGINIDLNTGIISGTLPATSATFNCTIQIEADNGTTQGSFSWEYSDYELQFIGSKSIESPLGSAFTGDVNVTVIDGSPVSNMVDVYTAGGVHNLGENTVTNGELILTVPKGASAQKTVILQGLAANNQETLVGAYQLTRV